MLSTRSFTLAHQEDNLAELLLVYTFLAHPTAPITRCGAHLEEGGVLREARPLEKCHGLGAAQHAVTVEVGSRKPVVVHLQLPPALRHGCRLQESAPLAGCTPCGTGESAGPGHRA